MTERIFKWCPECDARYSANPADYFWVTNDRPMICVECDVPFLLVYEETHIMVVSEEATVAAMERAQAEYQ